MIGHVGEGCKNAQIIYYKSLLGDIIVQTCSLTSIYNGIYTVCIMIHLNEQVRLIEVET